MKRLLTLLWASLLLLSVALPLTACSELDSLERMEEPEKAVRLAELAEIALTEAEQVYFRRSLLIKNPYFSSSCTVTERVSCVDGKDDYGYLKNTHEILRMGSDGIITTSEVGYRDGYTFAYHKAGVGESYFKAPADREEYRTQRAESDEIPQIGFRIGKDTCTATTVVHQEDGDWMVTYEGFSEARVHNFLVRQHELAKDLTVTHKPLDLVVILILSPEFQPTYASVEVKFHESAEYRRAEPSVTVTYDFALGASSDAEENLAAVDLAQYTELPDMAVLNAFFDGLDAHEGAVQGEFTVDTATTLSSGGETQTGSLPQTVKYANTSGGYRFTLEYEQEGKRYELSYAGTRAFQTVYGKTGNEIESKSTRMIDAQARLTVAQSMNPQSVTPADITSAELISEGMSLYRYVLRDESAMRISSILLNAVFTESQVEIPACSCRIEAQMPNGVLESYTLTLHAESLIDGEPLTLDTEITVIFYE